MKDIIVFDLDGTIADITHRLHLIKCDPPKWDEFYAACQDDVPIEPVLDILGAVVLDQREVWIVTGRSKAVQSETASWLDNNGIYFDELIMREVGDHRDDVDVKRQWLHDGTIPRERILYVFEDRARVVAMWRAEGLPCFQVAAGDF